MLLAVYAICCVVISSRRVGSLSRFQQHVITSNRAYNKVFGPIICLTSVEVVNLRAFWQPFAQCAFNHKDMLPNVAFGIGCRMLRGENPDIPAVKILPASPSATLAARPPQRMQMVMLDEPLSLSGKSPTPALARRMGRERL